MMERHNKNISKRSAVFLGEEIRLAQRAFELGARKWVVAQETRLPEAVLNRLMQELDAVHIGMLPVSLDWFEQWEHSQEISLFYTIWKRFERQQNHFLEKLNVVYFNYKSFFKSWYIVPRLDYTRAYMALKKIERDELISCRCSQCNISFFTSKKLDEKYLCAFCKTEHKKMTNKDKNRMITDILQSVGLPDISMRYRCSSRK